MVKNRLAKRAAADAGTAELDELLVGPTALTLIKGDAVIAAKAIADFAKEHDELEYKGGIMDGAALDPEGFKVIARLPGLDVLHGQLVGLAASPLTGLVAGLGNMISGLAIASSARSPSRAWSPARPPAARRGARRRAEEAPAEPEEAPAEDEAAGRGGARRRGAGRGRRSPSRAEEAPAEEDGRPRPSRGLRETDAEAERPMTTSRPRKRTPKARTSERNRRGGMKWRPS